MLRKSLVIFASVGVFALSGCVGRTPFFLSGSATTVELEPKDVVIQGPTQGTSSVTTVLGIQFGTPSYMQAEKAALDRQGSDVLLDRVRYDGIEGVYIPILGSFLGIDPQGRFLVFGKRTYYVEGVGAKFTR